MSSFFPNSSLKVFITGGNSGLGRALAEAYYRKGSIVIIGGRNQEALEEVAEQCPGMATRLIDLSDRGSIRDCAAWLKGEHPDLNLLINNAGIQKILKFDRELEETELCAEVEVNFIGLLLLTNALLPTLLAQPKAGIINVTSGLAYVPLASTPVYCATKAALRSFSTSLRYQLRETGVSVIEVVPPKVNTALHRDQQAEIPGMSVDEFLQQTLVGLNKGQEQIFIGKARYLRWLARLAPEWITKKLNATDPR
jgi:uncharacterized oxidoreductase